MQVSVRTRIGVAFLFGQKRAGRCLDHVIVLVDALPLPKLGVGIMRDDDVAARRPRVHLWIDLGFSYSHQAIDAKTLLLGFFLALRAVVKRLGLMRDVSVGRDELPYPAQRHVAAYANFRARLGAADGLQDSLDNALSSIMITRLYRPTGKPPGT